MAVRKGGVGSSGRIWWVHTSTWATDGATHTYAQLRCGPMRVRIAHRLTPREARTLDPLDASVSWEAGQTTIRFAGETEARAAAEAAWQLLATPDDVLCGRRPDQPQVPAAGPDRFVAAARRLQGTPAERAAAWRWLLLGMGYDAGNEAPDAPDELVMERTAKSWSLAGTSRAPRRRQPPGPPPISLGDVVVWPRRPPAHDGD